MEERSALYVRIPKAQAEKLDRAAFELKLPKQDLVAGLVAAYVEPDSRAGLERLSSVASSESRRRTEVVEIDQGLTVGSASFRPAEPREVLNLEELAQWLEIEPETVRRLAEKGDLPGRRIGDEWRFSRSAVLGWLGGD